MTGNLIHPTTAPTYALHDSHSSCSKGGKRVSVEACKTLAAEKRAQNQTHQLPTDPQNSHRRMIQPRVKRIQGSQMEAQWALPVDTKHSKGVSMCKVGGWGRVAGQTHLRWSGNPWFEPGRLAAAVSLKRSVGGGNKRGLPL